MTTTVPPVNDIAADLRLQTASPVLTPADAGYADALVGFNLHLHHHPDLVLLAQSAADVSTAVTVAARYGLPVTPVGAGHGALAAQEGGLAIVTRGLAGVTVDSDAAVVHVGAGTLWHEVIDATAPYGLAALAGSSPVVGVVGYVMGGGLGPVARTFGYAADHVRSIELVDGTGRLVLADAESEPEIFWALRGGKVGLGVVTSMTLDLLPVSELYAGGMYFAAPDIPSVLRGWLDWGRTIPESVTTSVAVLRLPPLPQLPEPLRGKLVMHLRVAHVGDPDEGERLVAPLRALATPVIDTIALMPYADLAQIHSDPVEPAPYTEGGALLDSFDHEALDVLLDLVGPDADVPLVAVELRQLGGALARQPEVANAVPGRDADFVLHVVGAPVPELIDTVLPGLIRQFVDAFEPWLSSADQPNFLGPANGSDALARSWPADVAERLDRVRSALGCG